jgi:L-alanine-DL-glutamate epimerase-like enolase superfamily enzyme
VRITGVEIAAVNLPLLEPFVVSYGTFQDLATVLVRLETDAEVTGWGEGTPDPHVTGETVEGVVATLRHLAPALLGRNPLDRSAAMRLLGSRLAGMPTAKAALDIALHDLAGRSVGLPVWALLGGRAREAVSISRVVSRKSPEAMAMDASRHVAAGFRTVKLKVGDARDIRGDVQRVAAVREAVGPDIGIKIDVNGGWHTAGAAIAAARGIVPYHPDYIEQPVGRRDLEGMAEVRRLCGVPVMADEAVLDARDALLAVRLRACDLINIKLMKCGGLLAALTLDAVAETAGVGSQIGTMVESSVASAAGLHLALALHNAATVEMGGPIMLAEDVGGLRAYYEHDWVTIPDGPGLGVEPDEAILQRYAGQRDWITA